MLSALALTPLPRRTSLRAAVGVGVRRGRLPVALALGILALARSGRVDHMSPPVHLLLVTSYWATLVTFAWAPAYDWEITVWDAPCGVTVLIKSRYPADGVPNRNDPKA
jgi:hypothetical protein